ncbi:MAG: hypothetical protein LBP78_06500 [Acidaminococcales bacterium]|jgi:hypothetical protein|nr:hypothetical protein [Acidaminococcales bacterium]
MDAKSVIKPGRRCIDDLKRRDEKLAKIIDGIGSISYAFYSGHFSFLVKTIIEQMLSKKRPTRFRIVLWFFAKIG